MNVIQALVLGLLQGLTEFIPVSSSGHLVLVPWLFGWPAPSMAFDTVLHLGTLAAILGFFWRDYVSLLRAAGDSIRRRSLDVPQSRLAWALVIGTIPAALLGYVAADWFEELFAAPAWVGVFLIMTGWLLLAGEAWAGRLHSATLEKMGAGVALLVGLAQGIAIAPAFRGPALPSPQGACWVCRAMTPRAFPSCWLRRSSRAPGHCRSSSSWSSAWIPREPCPWPSALRPR